MANAWTGQCHCGAVTVAMAIPPTETAQCNCSLCRKTGFIGVYGDPKDIVVKAPEQAMASYVQGDCMIAVWHCKTCGITTHWTPITAPPDRMGVNARLFDPELWHHLPVIHCDGASY